MAYSYIFYTGDGSTTNYAFSFPYIDEDHISVKVEGVAVGFSFLSSSTVQLDAAPAADATIEIRRTTPRGSTLVDFTDGSALLESDLDLLALYNLYTSQETSDELEQAIIQDATGQYDADNRRIINVADPVNAQDATTKTWVESTYSSAVTSASNSATAAATSATSAATSATSAATSATAASNSATAAAASESTVASSATAAASSATDAATSETNAASSATSASNSATSAANSATSASTSETNAASSATDASNSASSASTSATNASTSASSAASSATAAQTAQAAAELALDEFEDVYLGAQSSDPTLDRDGDALTAGDWYFNTTSNRVRIYDGSTWANVAVDASTVVSKTSSTGAAVLPTGTTGERDAAPSAGYIRFNSTETSFEGYDGSAWGAIGGGSGGATGGGGDQVFYENGQTITTSYTLTTSTNAMSTGPLTVNSGVSVTIPSGSRWVVL